MPMQRSIIALSLRDSFPKEDLPVLKGVEILPFKETAKLFFDLVSSGVVAMERGQKSFDSYNYIHSLCEKPEGQAVFLRVICRDVFENQAHEKLDPKKHAMIEMPGWLDNALQNRQP